MQYPGYLRYYDSVVRALAERGHHVVVGFDSPHKQPEGAKALETMPPLVRSMPNPVPNRADYWWPLARALRGTIDYARYLHPEYRDSPYLRSRMAKVLPPVAKWLTRIRSVPPALLRVIVRTLEACERAIPSGGRIEKFISYINPDVLIATPLVTDSSPQVDLIKTARKLGIPSVAGIASWDHLTTKGLMRIQPDRVLVWNETQRDEAQRFHGVRPDRIAVTGAQPFDKWFGRTPTRDRSAFCKRVGLPDESPFILFLGSTASISAPHAELEFVKRWLAAIRRDGSAQLRNISILIRPHPYNSEHWSDVDLSEFGAVAVWPRYGANPVDEGDRDDYFDSLYHCAAGVGVNTTAFIEAAIVGRVVHTVLADEFSYTQRGTLHFRYLSPDQGGCLRIARSLDEHLMQLADTLSAPEAWRERTRTFVQNFVRPHGLDRPATARAADAIEELIAAGRRQPAGVPLVLLPLTAFLWAIASLMLMADPPRFWRTLSRMRGRFTSRTGPARPMKSKTP